MKVFSFIPMTPFLREKTMPKKQLVIDGGEKILQKKERLEPVWQ